MKAISSDSCMIFTDTYFAGDLSKVASENISFRLAKRKYICPKVGNFEQEYLRLLPVAY